MSIWVKKTDHANKLPSSRFERQRSSIRLKASNSEYRSSEAMKLHFWMSLAWKVGTKIQTWISVVEGGRLWRSSLAAHSPKRKPCLSKMSSCSSFSFLPYEGFGSSSSCSMFWCSVCQKKLKENFQTLRLQCNCKLIIFRVHSARNADWVQLFCIYVLICLRAGVYLRHHWRALKSKRGTLLLHKNNDSVHFFSVISSLRQTVYSPRFSTYYTYERNIVDITFNFQLFSAPFLYSIMLHLSTWACPDSFVFISYWF